MSKVWYSDNEWPARARKLKFGGCLRGIKRVSGRCLEGVGLSLQEFERRKNFCERNKQAPRRG